MRSSIACTRCRRSKVKCVNNGVGSICRSCDNSGRECSYPPPLAGGGLGGPDRSRDGASIQSEGRTGEGGERKRARKSGAASATTGAATGENVRDGIQDVLDPTLLTPTVWKELFEIFQLHYSADLPFLHTTRFLKPMNTAPMQPPPSANTPSDPTTSRPPASPAFLLAFIALTSRFHPKLVERHSPPSANHPSRPLYAAEFYANAAHNRLLNVWYDHDVKNGIETVQILLMLGLHEWGMCRGQKAWITIGAAIRAAQANGLQYELDLDDEPLSRSKALTDEAERMGLSGPGGHGSSEGDMVKDAAESFVLQEVRRRTFWSCYIMDRYLSSGKYRPQMLHAKDLRIQLPASELAFSFGEKVRTLMLGQDEKDGPAGRDDGPRGASVRRDTGDTPDHRMTMDSPAPLPADEPLEVGSSEGLVSRYIKIIEIYGRVVRWSCAGGRRIEHHPPWDPRTEFYQLREQCEAFRESLPKKQALTSSNTGAHINQKSGAPYILMHTIYLLCQVMLHREYVPFIPIRCARPQGPLDEPVFPKDKYDIPDGFWEASAEDCFRSARKIMNLIGDCQEWNALAETPILGFAVYIVGFVGVYCTNFPWMDPKGYMCTPPLPPALKASAGSIKSERSLGYDAASKALQMIGSMRSRLYMAQGWHLTLNRMARYYKHIRIDYHRNHRALETSDESSDDRPPSTRELSLREGGPGGGLAEWKLLERQLKEFGNLEDVKMTEEASQTQSRQGGLDDESSAKSTVKSEDEPARPVPAPATSASGPWNAINTTVAPERHGSASIPTTNANGAFRSYDSYPSTSAPHHPQAPQPQSSYSNRPHQAPNFRPSHSNDPPGLTSPNSRTMSTPSQTSPPFDTHHPHHPYWSAHPSATPAYAGGPQHRPPHPSYPPPHQQSFSQNYALGYTPGPLPASTPFDPHKFNDAWLNSLDTRLGGDDLAAFAAGGDLGQFDMQEFGTQEGWLRNVFGTNAAEAQDMRAHGMEGRGGV